MAISAVAVGRHELRRHHYLPKQCRMGQAIIEAMPLSRKTRPKHKPSVLDCEGNEREREEVRGQRRTCLRRPKSSRRVSILTTCLVPFPVRSSLSTTSFPYSHPLTLLAAHSESADHVDRFRPQAPHAPQRLGCLAGQQAAQGCRARARQRCRAAQAQAAQERRVGRAT